MYGIVHYRRLDQMRSLDLPLSTQEVTHRYSRIQRSASDPRPVQLDTEHKAQGKAVKNHSLFVRGVPVQTEKALIASDGS